MKIKSNILLPALALVASAAVAAAQDNSATGGGGSGGPGGGRGGFNPEEFRARMEERVKTSLKVTDEEWKVLQPLIEKVQTKQRESMMGRFGGFGGGRGRGPGGDNGGGPGAGGPPPGGSPEGMALREALDKEGASPDDIKVKLAAVREARKKTAAELTAARAELQKVVSVRQEAVLVSMGVLE